jgi:O-antigen/teichoic acid export membrane protein
VVALVLLNSGLWALVSLNTGASILIGLLIALLVGAYGVKMKERLKWRPDLQLFGRMMRYGIKFHVSIVAAILIFRMDLLIVNHFRGAAEAGVYSVASQVAMMLMILPGVIATLLFPRVASAPGDKRGEMTCIVTRHTAFIMLIICLLMLPLSLALPFLYGAPFADATVQLWLLLPGVYLVSIESVLVQYFSASGLPRAIPLFWLATLVVNIALNIALVPGFGARGAALASTIAYAMIFALVMLYFRLKTGHSISSATLLRAAELRDLFDKKRFNALSREGHR